MRRDKTGRTLWDEIGRRNAAGPSPEERRYRVELMLRRRLDTDRAEAGIATRPQTHRRG
jgi:hypothetical protein